MDTPETTLLVVDDDVMSRDLLVRRLTRKGYRVLEAEDGLAALGVLAREDVALVLLDITMPKMDGLELLRLVRRDRSPAQLPIIMITARTDSQDAVTALDAGANDYVTKPVDFAVTLARVEAQLRLRASVSTAARVEAAARPAPPASPEVPLSPARVTAGTVLAGKYQIESRIGSGSFGTVYRARHLDLDVGVAVKILQRGMAATADARSRLQREGISACRIQHPNAVSVMDFGIDGQVVYLVMELLTGRSLEEELALAGRLSVARAAEITLPILSVLAAAHDSGIIHRDIKPANIFLHQTPRGEVVKVLDFGIAKLLDSPRQTTVGVVMGTPAYMPPERFTGGPSDPRADIYSLGTMLYQMLTGCLPFMPETRDPMALADMKVKGQVPPLRGVVAEIPEAVEQLVLATLARDVGSRPTAAELAERLAQAAGVPVGGATAAGPTAARAGAADLLSGDGEPTAVLPARPVD